MTAGPGPRAHDAEPEAPEAVTSEPETSEPETSEPETSEHTTASGESLEEFTERTAEVMADARKQVNRARETFHDQVLPDGLGADQVSYQDREPETGPASAPEPEPDSDSAADADTNANTNTNTNADAARQK